MHFRNVEEPELWERGSEEEGEVRPEGAGDRPVAPTGICKHLLSPARAERNHWTAQN